MKLNAEDREKIPQLTLQHYNRHAEEFWEGTRDHDVGQNIAALLQYIESMPHSTILDWLILFVPDPIKHWPWTPSCQAVA